MGTEKEGTDNSICLSVNLPLLFGSVINPPEACKQRIIMALLDPSILAGLGARSNGLEYTSELNPNRFLKFLEFASLKST